jgi:hypothetical protein
LEFETFEKSIFSYKLWATDYFFFFSLFLLFVLLDIVSFVYGGLAIDVPGKQVLTVDQLKCLFNQGYTIFIGQVYSPDGAFNEIGIQNMRNAREGKAQLF